VPGNLAGKNPFLTKENHFILLPWGCGQQYAEKFFRLSTTEERGHILDHPVSVEKMAVALVEEGCLIPYQDQFGG
jgi:hypothetical protein